MRQLFPTTAALLLLGACADRQATVTSPDLSPAMAASAAGQSGDYIVLFKPGTANPNAETDALIRAHGGTVKARYQHAVQGFAATLPTAALEGIRRNPNVELVEADGVARAIGTQTLLTGGTQWGLDRLDVRARTYDGFYNYEVDGTGVQVYILDTGIKLSHPEFGGRASFFGNYTTSGTDDVDGHGTHVAGTVGGTTTGVAKNASLFAVKVLGDDGSGAYSWIISGVDAVTAVKKATSSLRIVGNMSLGGGISSALNTAVNNSVAAGVVWAVAAGNSNANACNYSPAAAASALTVGATTSGDARSSFSNFGTCVDVFAPGSAIYSSTTNGGYASWNGTSMASPHVAGAAALFLSRYPAATAADVNNWVITNATTGLVTSAGTGSPNRLLNILGLGPSQPMHLGAFTGSRTVAKRNWSASASVTIQNAANAGVAGAVVTMSFTGAATGTATCTTSTSGSCTVSRTGLSLTSSAITFTVTGVAKVGFDYTPAANDVPATLTVNR